MGKIFAKFVQNETYPQELHEFLFSVITNSELASFSNSVGSHDKDDDTFSSLFCCTIDEFLLEKKWISPESTFLSKIRFLETFKPLKMLPIITLFHISQPGCSCEVFTY